jgi:hypothetical protein
MRVFERFPDTDICRVCGTNREGKCVLVGIDGTSDGRIQEAIPLHLECAVATNYNAGLGIIYRRVNTPEG